MQKTKSSPLVEAIQRTVANSYTMYMNYKRYHWNTFGPLFRDIHLLFDEHAAAILPGIDELGERVRMLGGESIGSPNEVAKFATIKEAKSGMTVREMLEQAISNHKIMISEFKQYTRAADKQDDLGTSDLFIRFVQVHEKQL